MPGSIIGELILQPILELAFHLIGYPVGAILIPIVSFGRIKCDRFLSSAPNGKKRWHNFHYRKGNQIHLTGEATSLCGVVIILIPVGIWFVIRYLNGEN